MMTQSAANKLLTRIRASGRGYVFTPKDFIDIACHVTVRKVLSRLEDEGSIRRLLRGVYDFPRTSTELNTPVNPDPDALAQAIARAHGWRIMPSGQMALCLLGLSSQEPACFEYYSDGPSKTYAWLGGSLIFKHRANKETTGLSPKTALLVLALKTLGQESIDDGILAQLRERLTDKERSRAAAEARYVTSWVYEIISRLAGTQAQPLS